MNHTAPDPPLTFYPAYCFALSPTYHTWARLTAADVHALTTRPGFEGQNLYFHLNHPIRWIRLVGAIVALDSYERRLVLTLDDSSGATIELTCAKPPVPTAPVTLPSTDNPHPHPHPHPQSRPKTVATEPLTGMSPSGNLLSLEGVDVGTVVKAKGGIGEFRGTRQLCLERIAVVETTEAEVTAWEEAVRFRMEVLARPWWVEEGARRRLEREAVGGKGKGKAKRAREKGRRKGRDRGEKEGERGAGGEREESKEEERSRRGGGEAKGRLHLRGDKHTRKYKHKRKRRESEKENLKGEG